MRETGNASVAVTAVSPRGEDSRRVVGLTTVYTLVLATGGPARLVPILKPGRASFFLQTRRVGSWRVGASPTESHKIERDQMTKNWLWVELLEIEST